MGEAGTQLERDCLPFVQLVDDLVDVWDINVSGISEWGEDATPSRFYPSGRQLPWQGAVKAVSKKPVLGVGRWTNPDMMVEAITTGKLDPAFAIFNRFQQRNRERMAHALKLLDLVLDQQEIADGEDDREQQAENDVADRRRGAADIIEIEVS